MKIRYSAFATLALASAALAQYSFDPAAPTTEAPAAPTTVAAPAPATSAAPAGAINFDQLRGNAYFNGVYGNMAAAFTVNDFLAWPHLFAGSKFLYVEPVIKSGTGAAPMGDKTLFMSLQNGAAPGLVTVGFASKDGMGVALEIAMNKQYASSEPPSTETTTIGAGDHLGASFSMPMGSNAFAAHLDWVTTEDQITTDSVAQTRSLINLDAHYSNFPSGASLLWDAFGGIVLASSEDDPEVGTSVVYQDNSYMSLGLGFNVGTKALSSGNARVFLGSDQLLVYTGYEDIEGANEGRTEIIVQMAPHLTGEYGFTPSWLMFAGARQPITLLEMTSEESPPPSSESALVFQNGGTNATIGLRYQNEGFAAEASLADALFADGTSALFNGANILVSFGAFLYF